MANKTTLDAKWNDSMKRTINAPCLVLEPDKAGRMIKHAPAVDCEWDCENCGFNPKVMQRRLAKIGNRKNDH